MRPLSLFCCVILGSLVVVPRVAEVATDVPAEPTSPIRELLLRRTDLDTFSPDEQVKIQTNQGLYRREILNKFFQTFDSVLTVNVHQFTELWERYLSGLRRNDLIDQRFQNSLLDNWMSLLEEHPAITSVERIPVAATRREMLRINDRRLKEEPVDPTATREQLESWITLSPGSLARSLEAANTELDALNKLQQARYLSTQGDHIRHVFFSLDRYLDRQRERGNTKTTDALSKTFFSALRFLLWNSPRETKLLQKLYNERVQQLGDHKAAVRSLEDLIAKVENNDPLRQLLDKLETEAPGNSASHLERFLELNGTDEDHIDMYQLQGLKKRFKIYRDKHPLDPRAIVRALKADYFPDFVKARRLFESCKMFSSQLGVEPGRTLKPLSRFYTDELQHWGVVDEHDAQGLHAIVEFVAPKDRKLGSLVTEDKIMEIMNKLGVPAEQQVVIISPYTPEFRQDLHTTAYRGRSNKAMQGVYFIKKNDDNIASFRMTPGYEDRKDIWQYVDSLTPRFVALGSGQVTLLDNFLMVGRKLPTSYYEKMAPMRFNIIHPPSLLHVTLLQKLLRPYSSVTGLLKFKNILGRYADRMIRIPKQRRFWVRYVLKMALQLYRVHRKVQISAFVQKLRDRNVPLFDGRMRTKIIAGQAVLPQSSQTVQKQFKAILGRYHEWSRMKGGAQRMRIKSVVSLAGLVKRMHQGMHLSVLLQQVRDREIPTEKPGMRIRMRNDPTSPNINTAQHAFKAITGRYEDTMKITPAMQMTLSTKIGVRGGNRARSHMDFAATLMRLHDRLVPGGKSSVFVKGNTSAKPTVAELYKGVFKAIIGRYKEITGLRSQQHFDLKSVIALVRKALVARTRTHLGLIMQRLVDRFDQFQKDHFHVRGNISVPKSPSTLQGHKTVVILGRAREAPMRFGGFGTHLHTFLLMRQSGVARLKSIVSATLQRIRDRDIPVDKLYHKVMQNIQLTLPCIRNVQTPDQVLVNSAAFASKMEGRRVTDLIYKSRLIEELMTLLAPSDNEREAMRKAIREGFETVVNKLGSNRPSLVQVYDTVAAKLPGPYQHGCEATSKHMILFGRVKDQRLFPFKFEGKMSSWISANLKFRLRHSSKFQASLQRLRDRVMDVKPVHMEVRQKWIFPPMKMTSKRDIRFGQYFGRTQDHPLVNPEYALALIGCFEQHYGDIQFGSWSQLHTNMKEYLDNVREVDTHDPSYQTIRRALIHLRPFYDHGNLNFGKFFSRFDWRVALKVDSAFNGLFLEQILYQISQGQCSTMVRFLRQLGRLVAILYPESFSQNVQTVINALTPRLDSFVAMQEEVLDQSCHNVASLLMDKPTPVVESLSEAARHAFRDLTRKKLTDLLKVSELMRRDGETKSHNFKDLQEFFQQNLGVFSSVYPPEMLNAATFVLQEISKRPKLTPKHVLNLTPYDYRALIKEHFQDIPDTSKDLADKLERGLDLLTTLFQKASGDFVPLAGATHYEFASSISDKMRFCSRTNTKITLAIGKFREKNIARQKNISLLVKAMESVARQGSFQAQRFQGLNVRMYDHILKPTVLRTMFGAYASHFGDLKFRDYKNHFKGLFARFVDTFKNAKVINKLEAQAVTKIMGDRTFYRNHAYNLNQVLVRFVSHDVAKYPPTKTSHLRKSLTEVMEGKQTLVRVKNLLGSLQRLRLKYKDDSVTEFLRAKKVLNVGMTYQKSKGARAFYRTFNKLVLFDGESKLKAFKEMTKVIRSIFRSKAKHGGLRRTIFKELNREMLHQLKFYRHQYNLFAKGQWHTQGSLKRMFYKHLQNELVNKLSFQSFAQPVAFKSRPGPGMRSFRRKQFKPFSSEKEIRQELKSMKRIGIGRTRRDKTRSIRRNRFKTIVSGESKGRRWDRFRASRGFRRGWKQMSVRRRRFKSFLKDMTQSMKAVKKPKDAFVEKKLVKSLSVARKRLKYVPTFADVKLQFLNKALSPALRDTLRHSPFVKRFFLKQLEGPDSLAARFKAYMTAKIAKDSIFLHDPTLKRYRLKTLLLYSPEQQFLSFLRQRFPAPFAKQLKKVQQITNKRMRLKALEDIMAKQLTFRNVKPGQSSSAILDTLRDFKRLFTQTSLKGKRIGGPEPQLEFIRYAQRLIKRTKKALDFGRVALPNFTDPGKRITPPGDGPIFCCGCICSTCLTDDRCRSGKGLEDCLEHQKRINADPTFIARAQSMVNLHPQVNLFINIRDPAGGYRLDKVLHASEDPNETLLTELQSAQYELRRKL